MISTKRLVKSVRRRERISRFVRYLVIGIMAAVSAGTISALIDMISARPLPIHSVLLFAIVGALFVSLLLAMVRPLHDRELLIRTELVLGSRSVIAASEELRPEHSDHPFAEALAERASQAAERGVSAHAERTVVPVRLPRVAISIPLLFVAYLVAFLLAGELRLRSSDDAIREAGTFLEEFGDALAARAEDDSLQESLDIAREMQRLGQELQTNRVSREEVERQLEDMSDRVRNQMGGLSRTDNPESSESDAPGQDTAPEGGRYAERSPTASEVEELYQKLLRNGELTDDEADFLEETLEELENPADANEMDPDARDRLSELSSRQERNDQRESLESAERALEQARERLAEDGEESIASGAAGAGDESTIDPGSEEQAGRRPEGDREDDSAGVGDGDAEGAVGAGDTSMEDEMDDDFVRSGNRSSALGEVAGEIESRERAVQTLVRNLPEESVAQIEYEDVLRVYEQQLERALVREEIPLSMRNYVRDYFLSISEPSSADEPGPAPPGNPQDGQNNASDS